MKLLYLPFVYLTLWLALCFQWSQVIDSLTDTKSLVNIQETKSNLFCLQLQERGYCCHLCLQQSTTLQGIVPLNGTHQHQEYAYTLG